MPVKVKRGLGLVVIALIALLIGLAASHDDGPNTLSDLAGIVTVLVGGYGLVLIALGLLRD